MAYTATYINESLLVDLVFDDVKTFNIDLWENILELSDNAVVDMAQIKGIIDSDSIETPLHFKFEEWARCYFYKELANNLMGVNNISAEQMDKYAKKGSFYYKRSEALEKQITKEVITKTVTSSGDRSAFKLLRRG